MNQREQTGFAENDARASEAVIAVQEVQGALKPRTTHVGKSYERLEDPAILTGRGRYGDDLGVSSQARCTRPSCARRTPMRN